MQTNLHWVAHPPRVDLSLPLGETWQHDQLKQMAEDLETVRPAIIDQEPAYLYIGKQWKSFINNFPNILIVRVFSFATFLIVILPKRANHQIMQSGNRA